MKDGAKRVHCALRQLNRQYPEVPVGSEKAFDVPNINTTTKEKAAKNLTCIGKLTRGFNISEGKR